MIARLALACLSLTLCTTGTALAAESGPTQVATDEVQALACPSETVCAAISVVSQQGRSQVHVFDPSEPATVTTAPINGNVSDVACPSAAQCTTVDGQGFAATFDPATPQTVKTERVLAAGALQAVSCPSTTQCTAVEFSNQGTPARQVTFDPTSPTLTEPVAIDPNGRLSTVDCPTATRCVAGDADGFAVSFDPRAKTPPAAPYRLFSRQIADLSCPGPTQCTAIENTEPGVAGNAVTFDPQSSPATAKPFVVTKPGSATTIDCLTAQECTALAGLGQVVTFDPKSRVTPTVRELFQPPARLGAAREVSCPTADQCTAIGVSGNQITFDPTPIKPTPTRLTVKRGTSVVAVVVVPNAKAGAKLTAELKKGNRRLKRATVRLGNDRSASFRIGKLGKGRYVATFRLGKTTVKTVRITVR